MAYYIDLFSPETYEAFTRSSRDISGFRLRHKGLAERIKPGDTFVCYLTRLSRWFGLLEVVEGPFIDHKLSLFPKMTRLWCALEFAKRYGSISTRLFLFTMTRFGMDSLSRKS